MNLVVTLANTRYIEKAKQVFSSLYFNGKWTGACMLLSYDVAPQKLKWFRERGILVKQCQPPYQKKITRYDPVVTTKLHIFDSDMTRWQNIIYLDSDVIVRKPLDKLTKIRGFAARAEADQGPLREEFASPKNLSQLMKMYLLKRRYDFESVAFNSGIIAFSTESMQPNSFTLLQRLLSQYGDISRYGEQAVLNLFFYKKWQSLDETYNTFPKYHEDILGIPPEKLFPAIIHFADVGEENKPWDTRNFFHNEWLTNLKKADQIHF